MRLSTSFIVHTIPLFMLYTQDNMYRLDMFPHGFDIKFFKREIRSDNGRIEELHDFAKFRPYQAIVYASHYNVTYDNWRLIPWP